MKRESPKSFVYENKRKCYHDGSRLRKISHKGKEDNKEVLEEGMLWEDRDRWRGLVVRWPK
jgi:hypothetical protein